ncbi:hypothetical protein [Cellulomonas uda]|uniref:Uncharacterized protein n=1 Tax=Cellulomonas uda TaxID=1714 RepID=A0A4Y3KFB0_CELUD|nr:hypothetical protein [Cellulomonas uda]NII66379.1 hypothetical protein [Cellulomonas uda]GEA82643.1 hypothetical protein CUD01_30870 [Cellulomonas uda]
MRELDALVNQALDADEADLTRVLSLEDLLTDVHRRTRRRRVVRTAATSVSSAAAVGLVAVGAYALGGADDPQPNPAQTGTPHETVTPTPAPTTTPTPPEPTTAPDPGARTIPTADPASILAQAGTGLQVYGPDGSVLEAVGRAASGPVAAGPDDLRTQVPGFDGSPQNVAATSTEGRYVASRLQDVDDEILYPPSDVGTWDGSTFRTWDRSAVVEDEVRSVGRFTVADGWVAWHESTGHEAWSGEWRVFAAREDGRDLHLVARSEEFFLDPAVDTTVPDQTVAILDGRVYWSTLRPDLEPWPAYSPDESDTMVVSRALDGTGEIRVEAVGATLAAGGFGRLVVNMVDPETKGLVTALLEDGRLRPLVANGGLTPALGDGFLAFTHEGSAYVLDLDEPVLGRISTPGAVLGEQPVADADHVAWPADLSDDEAVPHYDTLLYYDVAADVLRSTDTPSVWATYAGAVDTVDDQASWTFVEWAD